MCCGKFIPQWGAADAEIKVPSGKVNDNILTKTMIPATHF